MATTTFCWLVLRNEAQMIELSQAVSEMSTSKFSRDVPAYVRIYIQKSSDTQFVRIREFSRAAADGGSVQFVPVRHALVSTGNLHAATSEESWQTKEAAETWAADPLNEFFFAHRTDAFLIATATQA